ncbi:sulfatase family protein [Pararhizobium mangrovi]|uniref:sulfatase family protein n=1 Tax=Pararhizobium mangrovi TaxID=2590452 RepID=UPI0022A6D96D|nr:sulfatase [Pararhizobium mangrovi]
MKPNILFIMSDDHAAKAISAYGHGLNTTANIDRLAREGMRLDHCYVTNSICTPSRASILTGTYNHVNGVTTLDTHIDNRWPNVAKHLRHGGYQTAMVGKWHLGEGRAHEPTGFDFWSVLPGQGEYFDPVMIEMGEERKQSGYVTDIIADKCIDWLDARDADRPFFLMCHHKAPHRNFEPHPKNRDMFDGKDIKVPATYDDDYANRARAAEQARMRVRMDLKYADLGLVQPEGGDEVGELCVPGSTERRVPHPQDPRGLVLIDRHTGQSFTFETEEELALFKYQRYMKRYLATIHSIDENVGRMLDWLDDNGLAENTIVIYTSDQGFFLGEHGWFDKRFMYEESLQMPFLVRYPEGIKPGSVSSDIATNVDFATTFLDYAGLPVPSYMQGSSLRGVFEQSTPEGWQEIAYHRYWMHKDAHHNAWAHYGIRGHRYKLIYWYNSALGQPGALGADEPPEWELFDCETDPLELVNVAGDPEYADVFADMLERLDARMIAIGDTPEHDSKATLGSVNGRHPT